MTMKRLTLAFGVLSCCGLGLSAQTSTRPARSVTDPGVVTTRPIRTIEPGTLNPEP